jgi:hypothetical protein
MADDGVHEDIAFIRQTLEEGRAYARFRSPDFAVWGAIVALGYLGIYARAAGLWTLNPGLVWWPLIALGWLFSMRGAVARRGEARRGPAGRALGALWLGLGVTLMLFGIAQTVGDAHFSSMDEMVAGALGICFFASAAISGVTWLRWIAVGWWLAACVFMVLHDRPEAALAGAAFSFLLMCVPGLVLWLSPRRAHG